MPRYAIVAALAIAALAAACRSPHRDRASAGDAAATALATAPDDAAPAELVPPDAPADAAGFPPPPDGWVDIAAAIPDAVIDLHYATTNNFTGVVLYPVARCLLRAQVAAHLVAAADTVRRHGDRLLLWDCYRPSSIQQALWDHAPDKSFVAPPGRGSNHSRGAAVDISLADARGVPLVMPTDHDDFTAAASGRTAIGDARRNLSRLRAAMRDAGFHTIPNEWWHFDDGGAAAYAVSDQPFE